MIPSLKSYNGLNVTFQVTEDCNLRCRYCYEVHKRPGDLSLDYSRRFIDLLLEDPDPIGVRGTNLSWIIDSGLVLGFIGGDPLMRPGLCDDILKYFMFKSSLLGHKWASRWRISLSTNGTLFNEKEVRDFLLKYQRNVSMGVSVDGCPEIHNYNRSNSMDRILRDWDWYLWYAGRSASTKSTLNKESIPYMAKSLKFLHEDLSLKYINMNFIFEDMGLVEGDYDEIDRQLSEMREYLLIHCDDLYLNMMDESFGIGFPAREEQLSRGWCGAGSMPTLAVNGKIYPCFRFVPNTMNDESFDFNVGNVWEGMIHKERYQEIRNHTRGKISPAECLECPVESSCAYCLGSAFSETGTLYRQTNLCRIQKLIDIDKHSRLYWNEYYSLKGIDKKYEVLV